MSSMFACLRRVPHAHLLSHLRPPCRHERQLLTAALGSRSNNLTAGSRGYAASSSDGGANAEKKRHLYVVLDDHKDGYGIHRLDMAGADDDLDGGGGVRQLRDQPPVLRVAIPSIGERVQFAAVGSRIVAMGASPVIYRKFGYDEEDEMGAVLIYDTETAAMVVSPRLPEGLGYGYQAAIAVGEEKLYVLESEWGSLDTPEDAGGLHCLSSADHNPGARKQGDMEQWSPSSPWRWNDKVALPFEAEGITAHAVVHQDIFVSVYHGETFSFDTATWEWTRRGDWGMPVVGHAHYDGEMDAWVGLHDAGDTDGHLCAGNLMSALPEWKVGREKLFRLDELDASAGWRHVSAKLLPMAQGEYCLMERLQPEGDDDDHDKAGEWLGDDDKAEEWLGDGDKCLLRLTAFRVERGEDGEPVATALRPARSYKVSRYNKDFDAQAFWM